MASTFTDLVRGQSDEALAELLRARPDLIVPLPGDLSGLAARAQSRLSVTRALDQLNQFQLEILDGIRLTRDPTGHSSLDQVLAITAGAPGRADVPRVEAGQVRAAVRQLRQLLLVYGTDEALQVVAAVDEVLGPHPAGLGRPAAELSEACAALVGDPARLRRTLLSAPPAARAVLERLAVGPPVGATTDEPAADSPVAWLVSRGMLIATAPGAVELPRELGMLLRRDTGPLGELHPTPPGATSSGESAPDQPPAPDPAAADTAGAGAAMELVQRTDAMLTALGNEPATVLRSGGMGVRDLRRLARTVGVGEQLAALLLEVADAAGLIGEAEPERRGRAGARSEPAQEATFRPAAAYDNWAGASLAGRWHTLAKAWLLMTRQPGLVGQRDARDRLIGALATEVTRSGAPATRRTVLGVLATAPAGVAPSADEVLALVAWRAPRWSAGREPTARQVLAEAATLGLTGRGALTSYGAALLAEAHQPPEPEDDPLGVRAAGAADGLPGSAARLAELLPEPVAEVLVQADLSVVVPGPPEPLLAAELELVTEPESAGGGSVHRVTRESVRRALDAGYTAEDLHSLFKRRSRTAVPQGLSYLIDDVARAHGGLRIGTATAYLRSDDETLVAQVLADRRLAEVGLRRLAPTVLICASASRNRLLATLREAGYAPVPEDPSGAMVLVKPRTRRAPARSARATAPADPFAPLRMAAPRLLGIVEDLRRAETHHRARRRPGPGAANGAPVGGAQAHTEAMAILQQAVRDKTPVRVGYVDGHGSRTSRLVRPVSIGAGYLRAEDERSDTLHTFALHRITGATIEG
ncbi:helicase C-terminal domain-containing protein [Natronosporangium hydrolyticum]|uniref:Helicase C-terminal domain-containing protein n=1 Tax=Natronosporangium hydrolyticum TaxID=2811111 RepID=A0A895YG47_9ACTN|nr:helicase C-terminal domain-containing protein [Natronosporangium hydrolyticum]QSB14459.1 helicase C-terminal domain-containing protein [Natronosporangium hydrolyticum]